MALSPLLTVLRLILRRLIDNPGRIIVNRKKSIWIYTAIYFILILFVFFIIEISLRLAGAGYSTDFFLKTTVNNKLYLTPNSLFMAQYMTKNNVTVPECPPFYFPAEKGSSVFRIYVIGESTSQGFPYSKTEAFPYRMGQMLNSLELGKKAEVINFSMSAVNSHIGLVLAKEAVKYPPDLVIIYFGHNEFIGIGGAAEFNSIGFQINTLLSQLRIYQLIKEAVSGFGNQERNDLMTEMARKQGIIYGSDLYRKTVSDFSNNYEGMIKLFQSRGIPVIACGTAANLKDFPPVMGGFLQSNTGPDLEMIINKNPKGPDKEKLDAVIKNNAGACFMAGKLFLKNKNTQLARFYFRKACDLDSLRFRASSEIQAAVSSLAQKYGCLYIDMQAILDGFDRDGISGDALILEHVHPTLESAGIMAEKLADMIISNYFKMMPPVKYNITLYSTLVEKESAAGKLRNLFSVYPFTAVKYFNPKGFEGLYDIRIDPLKKGRLLMEPKKGIDTNELALVSKWLSPGDTLDNVHVKFGHYLFAGKNGRQRAEMEFRTAFEENPLNFYAANNLAVMRLTGGDIDGGLEMLEDLYTRRFRDKEFLENLWLVYSKQQKFEESKKIEKILLPLGADLNSIQELLIIGL